MNVLDPTPSRLQLATALAVLRVIVGVVFLVHGGQKLMMGLSDTTGMFVKMGIPAPSAAAAFTSIVEPLSGLALVLGLFARPAAVLLALDMLGAILLFHLPNGFFVPMGVEFTMTLCAAALAIALAGPGAFSMDAAIAKRRARA